MDGTMSGIGAGGARSCARAAALLQESIEAVGASPGAVHAGSHRRLLDYGEAIDGRGSDDVQIARIGELGPQFGLNLLGPRVVSGRRSMSGPL